MTAHDYNNAFDDLSLRGYRFALRSCGDKELSRDIVQEALTSLWEHRESVDREKSRSYLFGTIYRRLADHWRKLQPVVQEAREEAIAAPQEDFDAQEAVGLALATLPEIQRSLLQLKDVEGYSYKEIANILAISDRQVCVYLYRARVALKKKLIAYGYNDR